MNKAEAKKRIHKLRREINRHNYLYHVLDRPEISDGALDSLKNELVKLEQEFPELVTSDSPTQRVGGRALSAFEKVSHSSAMISLYDAFSEDEMRAWEERNRRLLEKASVKVQKISYHAELKMDGLASSLVYRSGRLWRGATRGDGRVGENVTANLRTVASIPLLLRIPEAKELKKIGLSENQSKRIIAAVTEGEIEIRGEVIMTEATLKKLNTAYATAGKPLLANARNAAAGSIRQLDPAITAERHLEFYVYGMATDFGLPTHHLEHDIAALLGFKVLRQNQVCADLSEAISFHHAWEKKRDKLPFECDGVVVVVDDMELWEELGTVGKGPRYMMAYKFANEQATTKVLGITWQVGRTGVLTPTAQLEPVSVKGVTIRNATLHNFDEIKRLGLRSGDTVVIERAGDVIPKVVSVLVQMRDGSEKEIKPPKTCPMCGGPVTRMGDEVAFRCLNRQCYAVNMRRLIHWVSKGATDIPGLGPKIIEQLVKAGLVSDPADFYHLRKDDLLLLERFAEKSASNVIAAIEGRRALSLERFINALGIPHIGEESARLLAQQIPVWAKQAKTSIDSPETIGIIFDRLSREDLEALPDVGGIVAESIELWFKDKLHRSFLKKLGRYGVSIKKTASKAASRRLVGKSFVLTGALERLTRDEAKATIREHGGSVASAVSRQTDYVIAGADPGSKYDKAQALGVSIITEEEFLDLIR